MPTDEITPVEDPLASIQRFIEWQEERAVRGLSSTVEDYREHLATDRHRAALARIVWESGVTTPGDGRTASELLTAIHVIATRALEGDPS